jgi:hypothetical protein
MVRSERGKRLEILALLMNWARRVDVVGADLEGRPTIGEPREKTGIIGETGGKQPTTKCTKDGNGKKMVGRTMDVRPRNRRVGDERGEKGKE